MSLGELCLIETTSKAFPETWNKTGSCISKLCSDVSENVAKARLFVYYMHLKRRKEKGKEGGRKKRGGDVTRNGGGLLFIWNDINVQKWFHMQKRGAEACSKKIIPG